MRNRGSRFLDFSDFQFLTTEFGMEKNSKNKVEKTFFFIFISSYSGMIFWGPKKRTSHQIGAKFFLFFKLVFKFVKSYVKKQFLGTLYFLLAITFSGACLFWNQRKIRGGIFWHTYRPIWRKYFWILFCDFFSFLGHKNSFPQRKTWT
jgi:F0F1-type ATP synthase membrane subunit a